MLYCICRKPYDKRARIACVQCGEWYHFDCIKLLSPPKIYICPACEPQKEESLSTQLGDHERLAIYIFIFSSYCLNMFIMLRFLGMFHT